MKSTQREQWQVGFCCNYKDIAEGRSSLAWNEAARHLSAPIRCKPKKRATVCGPQSRHVGASAANEIAAQDPMAIIETTMIKSEMLDLRKGGNLSASLLRRLDMAANNQYQAYNDLIADLSRGRERDIDWWACRPASRNNHTSDLYGQCIQLALIRQLLDESYHLTVMVDSEPLAQVLQQESGKNIKIVRERHTAPWFTQLKRRLRDMLGTLFHCVSAAVASRLTRSMARRLPAQPLTILNTFFMPDGISEGRFKNPDYPGLLEALSPEERAVCYFLPTFYRQRQYVATFRAMRKAEANFLFREDYLTLSDFIFALGHWVRAGKLKGKKVHFAGFEVGLLVDADIQAGRFSSTAVTALLSYRFLRSLADRNIRVRYILDWYEGMDLNHCAAAAINWHQPGIDLTGYRSAGSFFYMSATPAAHEAAMDVMPRTIAAVGARSAQAMQAICPPAKFVTGPGFRYRGIKSMHRKPEPGGSVLIALPMFLPLACDALTTLAGAQKETQAAHWWIKCHPGLPEHDIKAAMGTAIPAQFTFVDGNFYDWLPRATVVAGMGSSTLIEAVALGIPALCLTSGNSPTEIPLPSWVGPELHCVAYGAQEAAEALDKFLNTGRSVDTAQLQADLLSPATPAAIRQLLKLQS